MNVSQIFKAAWGDWLGPILFCALVVLAVALTPVPAIIGLAILSMGLFWDRVAGVLHECIGSSNDFFLGEIVNGNRQGGLIAHVQGMARSIFGWVRKHFAPRTPTILSVPQERCFRSRVLDHLAFVIGGKDKSFRLRLSNSLRAMAAETQAKYSRKQTAKTAIVNEELRKPQLSWSHLFGGFVVAGLCLLLTVSDAEILNKTLAAVLGGPPESLLSIGWLAASLEQLVVLCLVASGIVAGIYLFDLAGFLPVLPLHLFSLATRKWLLVISLALLVGAGLSACLFAMGRGESLTIDINSTLLAEPLTSDPGNEQFDATAGSIAILAQATENQGRYFRLGLILLQISVFIAAILSFNGIVVLAAFASIGLVATGGALVGFAASLLSLIYRLLTAVMGAVASALYFFLHVCRLIAAPVARVFHLPGTSVDRRLPGEAITPEPPRDHNDAYAINSAAPARVESPATDTIVQQVPLEGQAPGVAATSPETAQDLEPDETNSPSTGGWNPF